MFLFKLVSVLLVVSAIAADNQFSERRERCIKLVASRMDKIRIDANLSELVNESRKYYRDALDLIQANNATTERMYLEAMSKLLTPRECTTIEDKIREVAMKTRCFSSLRLAEDEKSIEDIAKASEGAKSVLEAHYSCKLSSKVPEQ